MRGDLLKKFIAQHDDVFMRIARQAVLVSAVVPDPRFAEKIETRAMHHFGVCGQTVRAKEDRRPECSFERTNQSPILFATFTHAEGLQHFGSALELATMGFISVSRDVIIGVLNAVFQRWPDPLMIIMKATIPGNPIPSSGV